MVWLKNLVFGAAAFAGGHAVEVYRWRDWFDPAAATAPWFLNAGSAVGLTRGRSGALAAAGGGDHSAQRP